MELTTDSWVVVPQGWHREQEGTIIYYLSPDNRKLSSLEEVITHLVTEGTCKCGLRCPVDVKKVFDFDPQKVPLPDHDENVLPEHSHCRKDRRPTLRKLSTQFQKDTTPNKGSAKSNAAKTNALSPNLSASTPPSKSVGVKRTMSFALLPEVRVGKKLKFVPKTFTVTSSSKIDGNKKKRKWSSGSGIVKRMKSKMSSNSSQLSDEDEVSKTKKLMSLLKKTNLTVSTAAKNIAAETTILSKSANKQIELALKSPPPNDASGGSFLDGVPSKMNQSRSGYCNVQEILKQAKLSLSREGNHNSPSPMLVEEQLPLTYKSNGVPEKSSAPSTNSKQQVSNSSENCSNQVTPSPDETPLSPFLTILKTDTNISSETQKHVQTNVSSMDGLKAGTPFPTIVTAITKDSDVDIETVIEGTATTVLAESSNQAIINPINLKENPSTENTSSPMSVQHVDDMNYAVSELFLPEQPFPTITDPQDDELGYLMNQLLPDPMDTCRTLDDTTMMGLGGGAPMENGGNHLPPTLRATEIETSGIMRSFGGKTESESLDGNLLALFDDTSSFLLPSSQELSKLMHNAMQLPPDGTPKPLQVAMSTSDDTNKNCSVRSSTDNTSPLESSCFAIGDQNCVQRIEADPLKKVTTVLNGGRENAQNLTEYRISDDDDSTSQNGSTENKPSSQKSSASTLCSPVGIVGLEDTRDVRIQIQNNDTLKSDDEESMTDNVCNADTAYSSEPSGHEMPQSNSSNPSQVDSTNMKSEATIPDLEPPSPLPMDALLNTNFSSSNIQPCTQYTVDTQLKNSNSNNQEMQSLKQHSTHLVSMSDQLHQSTLDPQSDHSEQFDETVQPSEDQDSQAPTNPSMDVPSEDEDSQAPTNDKPSEDQNSQTPTNPSMDKPSEDQNLQAPTNPSMEDSQAPTNPSMDIPSEDQDSQAPTNPSMDKQSEDQDSLSQAPTNPSMDTIPSEDQDSQAPTNPSMDTIPSDSQTPTNPSMDIPSENQDSQAPTNPSMDILSEDEDSQASTNPSMDKQSEDQNLQAPTNPSMDKQSEDQDSQASTNPSMDIPSEDQDSHAPTNPSMDKQSEDQDSQAPTNPSMDTIPSEDQDSQAPTNLSMDTIPSDSQTPTNPSMDIPSENQDSQAPTNPSMDILSEDEDSTNPSMDKQSEDQDSQAPTNLSMDTIPSEDQDSQAPTNPSMDTIPSEDQDSQAPTNHTIPSDSQAPTNPPMDTPSEDQNSQAPTNPSMDITSENQDSQASINPPMDIPSEDQDSQAPTNPSMDKPSEYQDPTNPSMDIQSEDQDPTNPSMDIPSEDQDSQAPTNPSMDKQSEDQDSQAPTNPSMDIPSEDQDSQASTNPSMDTIPSEDQDSQANPSMDTIPSEDQDSQTNPSMDTIPSEHQDPTNPSMDTFLVEQFLDNDQQSGSSNHTSSVQLKSAASFCNPPLVSSSLVTDSVSRSVAVSSVSAVSSKLENGLTNEPSETTDLINGGSSTKANSFESCKTMVDHSKPVIQTKDDPLDFEEGLYSFSKSNFRKLYPTRSKSRPVLDQTPSLSKVLGKRGRSVPMELKSPLSETSSVDDSVFEEKKCGAPKRGKRKNVSESRPVSTPHSSTSAPDLEPSTSPHTSMVGHIVWAKASQLPGWPGQIISHEKRPGMETPPENMVWVEWFGGGSTVSMVDVANVRPLEEGVRIKKKKKVTKKLEKAINQARKAIAKAAAA